MPHAPKAKNQEPSPPRKRRWPRRLLIFLLVVAALALFLNGPGGRWIVRKVVTDQLSKQGLTGSLEVHGRLLTGLALHNVHFSGGPTIEELHASKLALDYWLPDLLDKKIKRVDAADIRITVTSASTPDEEPDEESTPLDLDGIRDVIQSTRDLVLPIGLSLTHIDFTLKRPDREPLTVTLGALRHEGGTRYDLKELESNALGPEGLRRQDFHLDWKADSLTLNRVELLPNVAVEQLVLKLPKTESISLATALLAANSRFDLTADEAGNLTAVLSKSTLDLAILTKSFAPDLALAGTINTLSITGTNLLAPFTDSEQEWDANIEIDASNLAWPNGSLDSITATLVIDDDCRLNASLGPDLTLNATVPHPDTGRSDFGAWLENLPIKLDLAAPDLPAALARILPAAGQEVPENLPAGAFTVNGTIGLDDSHQPAVATLNWSFSDIKYQEKPIPALDGEIALMDGTARLTAGLHNEESERNLSLDVSYVLAENTYTAGLTADIVDSQWIADLIPSEDPLWKPRGPLSLEWSGQGSLPDATHSGKAELKQLTVTAPEDTLAAAKFTASYEWPGTVGLSALDLRIGEFWLEGAVDWTEERLDIRTLRLHDQTGPLTNLNGSLPLAADALSAEDFLRQPGPVSLTFRADALRLRRLGRLLTLDLPDAGNPTFDSLLKIGGTLQVPDISADIKATGIRFPKPAGLPALNASLKLRTENKQLIANGTVREEAGQLVALDATLPFDLPALVDNPDAFLDSKLSAKGAITKLPLTRLGVLSSRFEKAEGSFVTNLAASGTLRKPALAGKAVLDVKRYPLPDTPYRQILDSKLTLELSPERLTIVPSIINIAGGTLTLSGNVDLAGDEPNLAIQLDADHALLWRDDSFSFRADTDSKLTLAGPWSAARLTGSIDLVESLAYKDIEIIPIGVPTTSVPKPSLPKIDKKSTGGPLVPAPAPFGDWTLDVKISTKDDILIRGNLATGEVALVNASVGGTISAPEPSGTIELRDISAVLPFSTLKVKKGQIVLRPEAPLNPILDIKGSSSINRRQVSMLVFGPLNNPSYTMSSDPPLPESEILTLIATGSTTEDLEDTNTASMKAFQLMIEELRRHSSKPGGNAAFKRILQELKDVELNVGENDPFTGRKFSSATLQLPDNDKYFLSAGFDAEGHTRASIIYSLRFR